MDEKTKKTLINSVTAITVFLSFFLIISAVKQAYEIGFVGLDSQELPTIQTRGEGEVKVVPDIAKISFAVVTQHEKNEEALTENNKKTDSVIVFLKESGIDKKKIHTSGFNVRQLYRWIEDPEARESKRETYAFEVRNLVDVTIEEMDLLGEVLDGAVRAGATEVNNLQFETKDKKKHEKIARDLAIKEARERAEEIAQSLGVSVKRVVNFSEERDISMPYMMRGALEYDSIAEEGVGEVPVEPGEEKVKINVVVTFEIR